MRCTAIVVNYHCAEQTLVAAESVAREGISSVCVVDNSTDAGERTWLAEGLPPGSQLWASGRNLGFGAACNLAWRETTAEYVLLLNPDARLLPGALAALIATLDADPRLAAVAPATWWDDAQHWLLPTLLPETIGQWLKTALARRFPDSLGLRLAQRWLAWQQRLHAGHGPQSVDYLSGAVVLLRRAAVEKAGGLFDERFFMFYEDADLSRRLRRAGFELALLPQAQAIHHWRNRASKAHWMAKSAALYLARHYPRLARLAEHAGIPLTDPFLPLAGKVSLPDQPPAFSDFMTWAQWLQEAPLICLSPSMTGYPAIFRPAGKAPLAVDETLWNALDPGRYRILTHAPTGPVWRSFVKETLIDSSLSLGERAGGRATD